MLIVVGRDERGEPLFRRSGRGTSQLAAQFAAQPRLLGRLRVDLVDLVDLSPCFAFFLGVVRAASTKKRVQLVEPCALYK